LSRSSTIRKDGTGAEHLIMHFNVCLPFLHPHLYSKSDPLQVEGPLSKGVVNLHMTKRPSQQEFEYKYLSLDVKGHQRIYLENTDTPVNSLAKGKTKLFGVQWTR
jgi:mitochondrial import inner membrane translocase subunit TIM21